MADDKTPSNPAVAHATSRQGTASPPSAEQEAEQAPSTTSRQNTASPAAAPSNDSTANTATAPGATDTTPAADEQDEQEDLPELGEYDSVADSALGSGGSASRGSTSIASSIRAGQWYAGRRYQVTRENGFNIPSDDKQFESMHSGHLAYSNLESLRDNPFFRAPVSKNAQRVIDLGTGSGGWASDVADMFPNLTVYGVDLYPPPQTWVPPNCILEVDDITKKWTWNDKFDLVHMRLLLGAFSRKDWKMVYAEAYRNLKPGGWIEQVEVDMEICSMEPKPLPANAKLHTWKPIIAAATENAGNATDLFEFMREEIEGAGFINVHEHTFKLPLGSWPQHPIYKEAGRLSMAHIREGINGWVAYGLAKYGAPQPWSQAEITVWCALLRQELDAGYSLFQWNKRIWAQKPFDTEKAEPKQPEVINVVDKESPAAASKA